MSISWLPKAVVAPSVLALTLAAGCDGESARATTFTITGGLNVRLDTGGGADWAAEPADACPAAMTGGIRRGSVVWVLARDDSRVLALAILGSGRRTADPAGCRFELTVAEVPGGHSGYRISLPEVPLTALFTETQLRVPVEIEIPISNS